MEESEIRMAALCKRLGGMWSQKPIKALDGEISAQKIQECQLSLIGHLYLNPKINFQAFQTTMKRAWKMENVEIAQIAEGIFEFKFRSAQDRNRIWNQGPWSFANHLLILKPWEPNMPPTCYNFDKCEFWVHVYGLPTEWTTEKVIKSIAEEIGEVMAVKIDVRGPSLLKMGKAKVVFDLSRPLISGSFYSNMGKNLWLDFRYERLPYYCYSCGRLGHYAHYCQLIPYSEEKPIRSFPYGSWLKVEANEESPFREIFYGMTLEELMEDIENVPETQLTAGPLVMYEPINEDGILERDREKGKEPLQEVSPWETSGECLPTFPLESAEYLGTAKVGNKKESLESPKSFKCSPSKHSQGRKLKRYSPYEKQPQAEDKFDETALLDAPILLMEEEQNWALVACPKKPPRNQ